MNASSSIPFPLDLLDLLPAGIAVQRDGCFIFANLTLARMFGYDCADELVGRSIFAVIHPAWHDEVAALRQSRFYAAAQPFTIAGQRRDGSVFQAYVLPRLVEAPIPNGNLTLAIVIEGDTMHRAIAAANPELAEMGDTTFERLTTLFSRSRPAAPTPAVPREGGPAGLTRREAAVAERLAQGDSVSQAASRLGISSNTVRNHLKAVYRKLGVHSRVELVVRCLGGGSAEQLAR
jgi:PAS domain S-box-containing protein